MAKRDEELAAATPEEVADLLFRQGRIDEEQRLYAVNACRALGIGPVFEDGGLGWRFTVRGMEPLLWDDHDKAALMRKLAMQIAIMLFGQIEREGTIEGVIKAALAGAWLVDCGSHPE